LAREPTTLLGREHIYNLTRSRVVELRSLRFRRRATITV
jgi:hypothetical protein